MNNAVPHTTFVRLFFFLFHFSLQNASGIDVLGYDTCIVGEKLCGTGFGLTFCRVRGKIEDEFRN